LFIGGENMQNNDWMNMIENMNGIRLFSRSLIPRATKEHEISSQHLDLLCHLIINNDGMTPLKLSKVMGVSKTIISRLIDGLSKSGYVIKKQDDNVEVFFIAGADSLMAIEKWRNTDLVLNNCTFVAFNRGEYNKSILEEQKYKLEKKYDAKIVILNVTDIDISSSMIRERIANGKRVDFFLPEEVKKYISENKLYRRE
jgi:nicotinate (nicotinamide) nucleotide adenylyltransferase